MPKAPKRPRDPNQLGKSIIDIATGNAQPALTKKRKLAKRQVKKTKGKEKKRNS